MIVVVMGVSGSGKTTVGRLLAETLGWRFLDGDELHSRANVDKMSRGIPLTDTDRAAWLSAIHARMADAFTRGESLVVACSALKESYRAQLAGHLPVTWVYLRASLELVRTRLTERAGHFMKADMAASQFATLEEPSEAMTMDASREPGAIVEQIVAGLRAADRMRPAHPGGMRDAD